MAAINNVETAQHDPRIGRCEEWIRICRYPRYMAAIDSVTIGDSRSA